MMSEPFRYKEVANVKKPSFDERREALKNAQYNPEMVDSEKTYLDLTDSGFAAMTDYQWAGLNVGDEAYEGPRGWITLQNTVKEVLGYEYMMPTHNIQGAWHLIAMLLVEENNIVLSNQNDPILCEHIDQEGGNVENIGIEESLSPSEEHPFKANVDLEKLKRYIEETPENISFINIATCPDRNGGHPISLGNLKEVYEIAEENEVPVVLDISRVIENAYLAREREESQKGKSLKEIILQMLDYAQICVADAREMAKATNGALIISNKKEIYDKLCESVVMFEGLFTYGGLCGRDLETIVRGLEEMMDEEDAEWRMEQVGRVYKKLIESDVPIVRPMGGNGVYIDASEFLESIPEDRLPSLSLANALYTSSGVRIAERGRVYQRGYDPEALELASLCVPKRVYDWSQLNYAAQSIIELYKEREKIPGLKVEKEHPRVGIYSPVSDFSPDESLRVEVDPEPLPWRAVSVERLYGISKEERKKRLKEEDYNTGRLKSLEDVGIDLMTDSGTGAMSNTQWSELYGAEESGGRTKAYSKLVEAVQDVFGFKYVVPAHQGRASEHIVSQCMIEEGQHVLMNKYFSTTRFHIELAGGRYYETIVDEADEPETDFLWKGNVDLDKLRNGINELGPENIAYASLAPTVNEAGGYPFQMKNIREASKILHENDILLIYDATRCNENAWFIKEFEEGYENKSIKEILREMMSYADGCSMSGKKDPLGNIGGFAACNDEELYKEWREFAELYEGHPQTGGLSARDMSALAAGLREMVDEDYIKGRTLLTRYLGELLLKAGVPISEPPAAMSVMLDAKRFCPHLDKEDYPGRGVHHAMYVESGVRAGSMDSVHAGKDPDTGKRMWAENEYVRLAIPRRVYTYDHMKEVAEGVERAYKNRDKIGGVKIVYEPEELGFFNIKLAPTEGKYVYDG